MKILKWTLLITVLCITAFVLNISFKRVSKSKDAQKRRSTIPSLSMYSLDSTTFNLAKYNGKPLVLIHFNSDCEHCQYQVEDITAKVDRFVNADVLFMSSQTFTEIQSFVSKYNLDSYQNIDVVKVDGNEAGTAFGNLMIPHIFIYGSNRVLMKEFKGETTSEAILKVLLNDEKNP